MGRFAYDSDCDLLSLTASGQDLNNMLKLCVLIEVYYGYIIGLLSIFFITEQC